MATWSNGISLRGADGKSLRTGTGAPSSTYPAVQADGDTYLDLASGDVYANRTNGQWPATRSFNIVGAMGPASIVPVNAPPGPNVGSLNGYAIFINGTQTQLYGPKTANGWTQLADGSAPAFTLLTGATGSNATLPKDFTPNSVAIAPFSGDTNASVLTQKDSNGATLFASDASGNVTVAGTLNVAGKSTLAALAATSSAISGSETVGGDLNVTGTATVGALTASATNIAGNQVIQGNDTVNGDLKVLGNTSLQALNAAGASTLAGVTATTLSASGNASVGGTLGVTGKATLGQVASSSIANTGAVTVGTTLGVTGAATLSAAASVGADLTVAGTCQLKGINASNLVTTGGVSVGAGLTVTGTVNPLGNLNVNNNALIQGTFTVSGNTSLQATNAVTLNASQTLSVTGASTLAGVSCSSLSNSGNETVGGTLKVTGATTLAGVSATSVNNSGNEAVGGTLSVTGSASTGALTANGITNTNNETIAGTLAVNGSTTLAGLTASSVNSPGTVTAKNLTLTTGGVFTFPDGTTMSTAASGTGGSSSSASGLDTVYLGLHQASSGNYPTAYTANNGYFVNTQYVSTTSVSASGSAYVTPYAGTIYSIQVFAVSSVAGISVCLYKNGQATALVATSSTSSGGFYATPASPINVVAGDLLQLFVKGTSSSISNSLIGWCTIQQSGSVTGSASRFILDAGGFYSSNQSANALYTLQHTQSNDASVNTQAAVLSTLWKVPYACTLTGWMINQMTNNGTQAFQVTKNRTSGSLNSIYSNTNAGNATANTFPYNQFSGTLTKGTYNFAAGDIIGVVYQHSSGGVTNLKMMLIFEWT